MATHQSHTPAHHHAEDGPQSTLSGYMAGFLLSVVLTAVPFWLVMSGTIADRTLAVLLLGGLAMVQIFVHMVFFLHMDGKTEGGWTMLSTIFTVIFVIIALSGTLWVMYHMNTNMMPSHGDSHGAPALHQHEHVH